VLITGWQAPNTLGRRLVEHVSPIRIFGQEYEVKAQVEKLNGFSGHADGNGLMEWVTAMEKRPQQTFLVHGELDQATALKSRLVEELSLKDVYIPELHAQYQIP
jgi:metallo-beta-lactamase family protein